MDVETMDERTQRVIRTILMEGLPLPQRIANYVTRVALVATMDEWRDQDKVVAAARAACAAYRAGFLEGLGVHSTPDDPEWFRVGLADGAAALRAQVDRVAHDPRFSARTGSEQASEDVIEEIRRLVRGCADEIDRVLSETADKEIKTLYVRLWREGSAGSDRDEGQLRARLGLSVAGCVDTLPLGPPRQRA